jgi:carboxyl-terminal processing protease
MKIRENSDETPMGGLLKHGLVVLLIVGVGLTYWFYERNFNRSENRFSAELMGDQTVIADRKNLLRDYEQILNTASDQDLSLIQLTLSLIEGYYVDSHRFNFETLLISSLDSMKHHGVLRYSRSSSYIEIKNAQKKLQIPIVWMRDEIGKIVTVIQLSRFLDIKKYWKNDHKNSVVETLALLVSSLDPYSRLLSEEDYKELKEGTEGEFGGLGLMVGVRNSLLTVIKLLPHSPAFRAGIHPLDKILSINGNLTFGASLEDLIKIMKGEPGSTAKISFLREGAKSPFDISMNRELLQIDPLSIEHLKTERKNNVLLLKLDTFSIKSYDRIKSVLTKNISSKKNPIDGIILDLRSNPGGLLEQAVNISKLFISDGPIVSVNGRENETEYASYENLNIDCPIVVLIDEDSASASEILTGALKDNNRAIVIGQASYGKGTVQSLFELPEGRALKLTIARYLTPSGHSIQGTGIIPDIYLHPIDFHDENRNLMGDYRYRVEGPFLGYQLEKTKLHSSPLEAYYFRDKGTQSELTVALDVIDEYKKEGLNSTSFKKSGFLEKVKQSLGSKIKNWDNKAISFLKKMKVSWYPQRDSIIRNSLSIVESTVETTGKIYAGSLYTLSFSLQNKNVKPTERVSVFVRSRYREMNTVEKLIGTVTSGKLIHDHLKVEIPSFWMAGRVEFQIGIAVDGNVLEDTLQSYFLDIADKNETVLLVSSSLKSVVKSGQTVHLVVYVQNESDHSVILDSLDVTNLSGKQVSVKMIAPDFAHEIPAHEKSTYFIELTGAKEILSKQLNLGLSIESHELKKPIYKILYANSIPTQRSK